MTEVQTAYRKSGILFFLWYTQRRALKRVTDQVTAGGGKVRHVELIRHTSLGEKIVMLLKLIFTGFMYTSIPSHNVVAEYPDHV